MNAASNARAAGSTASTMLGHGTIIPMLRIRTMSNSVAAMIDASDDLHFENTVALADITLRRKTTAADACIDAVRLALEIGGGQAFDRSCGIERLFRDVHGCLYHPLPAAQQELFTGRLVI